MARHELSRDELLAELIKADAIIAALREEAVGLHEGRLLSRYAQDYYTTPPRLEDVRVLAENHVDEIIRRATEKA